MIVGQTHFLRIEVFDGPRNVFSQREAVKPLDDGCLHNFFEGVFCMAAKLSGVTVMRVRHTIDSPGWRLISPQPIIGCGRLSIYMRFVGGIFSLVDAVQLWMITVRWCTACRVAQTKLQVMKSSGSKGMT